MRRKFEALKAAYHKRGLSRQGRNSVTAYKLRSKALGLAKRLWPDGKDLDEHTRDLYPMGALRQ